MRRNTNKPATPRNVSVDGSGTEGTVMVMVPPVTKRLWEPPSPCSKEQLMPTQCGSIFIASLSWLRGFPVNVNLAGRPLPWFNVSQCSHALSCVRFLVHQLLVFTKH